MKNKKIIFNQKKLEKDKKANFNRPYQQCSKSVMDTIADPNITFDSDGICNYYREYLYAEKNYVFKGELGRLKLKEDISRIKKQSIGKKYDCILGLSGGVDSSFLCLLAKKEGLNPLVVHFDNGWNSELAQHNIENTIQKCGFDLQTYVVNWEEFKELQLSYLKASVVDIEVLTDQGFMSILYQQARKWNIKFVLAGMNVATEQVLPSYWVYNKSDTINIKSIQKEFGNKPLSSLKSYPFLNYFTRKYCTDLLNLEVISPLNYIEYNYNSVKEIIKSELGWRDYGGKHYESIWTRFYQGFILPTKFNIDKRKAHLSNLIFSGQITKEEALEKLKSQPYESFDLMLQDKNYVLKKFGITEILFDEYMKMERREHKEFKFLQSIWETYPFLKPFRKIVKR